MLSGGWWYPSPGTAGGVWERRPLGEPLYNVATVADFDGDGDLDVLGTDGQVYGSAFAWAENDGQGNFSVHPAIAQGGGDFLQGVAAGRFHSGAIEVALSWHEGGPGIEHLIVPTIGRTGWSLLRRRKSRRTTSLAAATSTATAIPTCCWALSGCATTGMPGLR